MRTMLDDILAIAGGILPMDRSDMKDFLRNCRVAGDNAASDDAGYERPAMRKTSDDKGATVYIDLPGVKKESIDASVDSGSYKITVVAARNDGSCKYRGVITAGEEYDLDKVSTAYSDGVLTVKIPLKEVKSAVRKLTIG